MQCFGCRRLISQYFSEFLLSESLSNAKNTGLVKHKARCCPISLHDYCHWHLGTAPRARGCSKSRGGKAQLLTWQLWRKHRGGNFLHLLQLLSSICLQIQTESFVGRTGCHLLYFSKHLLYSSAYRTILFCTRWEWMSWALDMTAAWMFSCKHKNSTRWGGWIDTQ